MNHYVATYTTISATTSKLVRRQLIVEADSREEAINKAIKELTDDGAPFKVNSVKQWDIDNLTAKQLAPVGTTERAKQDAEAVLASNKKK